MEQIVRVQRVFDNGTAQVLRVRRSACSGDCHHCAGCGAVTQNMLLTAENPLGAQPGDAVIIRSDSGAVLRDAGVLYAVPMLLFFIGYLLGSALWQHGAAAGGVGFAAGIALAVAYDRLIVSKRKTIYTISGYAAQQTA